MKKKQAWYLIGVLILGLTLLAVSCAGTTPAPAEKPSAPTEGPPEIPHALEGLDDCLMCHEGEGAAKLIPADHTGRTSDTCTKCHKP